MAVDGLCEKGVNFLAGFQINKATMAITLSGNREHPEIEQMINFFKRYPDIF